MLGSKCSLVVEEVQSKVHQTPRDWLSINLEVRLRQVPTARSHKEDGRLGACDSIHLLGARVFITNVAVHCIPQVDVAFYKVAPGRCQRVLKVRLRKRCFISLSLELQIVFELVKLSSATFLLMNWSLSIRNALAGAVLVRNFASEIPLVFLDG
jgi:hypothetical protein